jgi:hypothetical protein
MVIKFCQLWSIIPKTINFDTISEKEKNANFSQKFIQHLPTYAQYV